MQPPAYTHVIILAATALQQAAWEALLNRQPGLIVWGSATSLDALRALEPTNGQTTVLIDVLESLPDILQRLVTDRPDYGLLCLIDRYDLAQVVTLLRAGADGCLIRNATVPDLARAIIAAGRGEIVLPPSLAARALTALARGGLTQEPGVEKLTPRETDVLGLLAEGLTNKDIAQSLFLSVRTVEAHLRNVYSKLGIGSRTEAVLWALNHDFESAGEARLGNST